MDRDAVWKTIDDERLSLADLLDDLSPAEWETPSLCTGWRVRDVAAQSGHRDPVAAGTHYAAGRRCGSGLARFQSAPGRLGGCGEVRFPATEHEWSVGEGELVEGPISALVLLVTGRRAAALARLRGPGVTQLA